MEPAPELVAEMSRPQREFGAEYLISGAVDPQVAADVAYRWQHQGGTHVSVRTMRQGFTVPEQYIDYLAEVKARLS